MTSSIYPDDVIKRVKVPSIFYKKGFVYKSMF